MKKILFNDRFVLTQAVLNGRKTMTRRICKDQSWSKSDILAFNYDRLTLMTPPNYLIGDVVAIGQSYETLANSGCCYLDKMMDGALSMKKEYAGAGYKNKMFVKAELMPHHIKITNIRVEHLQDISDEDCMREGVVKNTIGYYVDGLKCKDWEKESHIEMENGETLKLFPTPREAFAALIDKVSGKGTWDSNPLVFCYSFKLID